MCSNNGTGVHPDSGPAENVFSGTTATSEAFEPKGSSGELVDRLQRRISLSLGTKDGTNWANAAHPNELAVFLQHCRDWSAETSPGASRLRNNLMRSLPFYFKGDDLYRESFNCQVHEMYLFFALPWKSRNYCEGLADGASWAENPDAAEELERIRHFNISYYWPDFFPHQFEPVDPDTTAAHCLLRCLQRAPIGRYCTSLDACHSVGEATFREFWARFVAEPVNDIRSKLLVPEYAIGFGDGALGKGKSLDDRLKKARLWPASRQPAAAPRKQKRS